MQWLSDLYSGDKSVVQIAILAASAIAALVVLALAYRYVFAHRLRVPGGRTRQPRLGLVDAFSLDGQRQLVLVRRDNVEHLIMIGGPNDVLVESQINRTLAPREVAPAAALNGQNNRRERGRGAASGAHAYSGARSGEAGDRRADRVRVPAGPRRSPSAGGSRTGRRSQRLRRPRAISLVRVIFRRPASKRSPRRPIVRMSRRRGPRLRQSRRRSLRDGTSAPEPAASAEIAPAQVASAQVVPRPGRAWPGRRGAAPTACRPEAGSRRPSDCSLDADAASPSCAGVDAAAKSSRRWLGRTARALPGNQGWRPGLPALARQ